MNYCIIGNSIAATAAIEGIRSLDKTGAITVISDEKDPVYGRPLISYWLEEKVKNENMFYRDPAFYEKNNVKVMLDTKVIKINSQQKTVSFSSGGEMVYDKLLISSGGKPIVPPLPGLTESCYSCFFNYEDVRTIKNRVKAGDHVAVLGGGLTGLKATESLHRLGIKVSLIELADRLLGTIMDQTGSEIAADFLREKGVDIYLGNTIEKIEPDHNGFQLYLKDKSVLNCSLLVMAIGVSPRVDFLKDSGLKMNRGILVDASQITSLPEVFAAGDVAEVPDFLTGRTVVAPILPNAFTQGRIAGINMAGGSAQFEGSLAYNAIGFLGLHTVSMGLSNLEAAPDLEILEERDPHRHTYRRLIIKNNRLIGAIFIESIGRAGLYQDLIRSQADLSSFKERLLSPEFNLLDLPEEVYQAKLAQ
jgi:NAD(P)H-nitrite reductase large subunit